MEIAADGHEGIPITLRRGIEQQLTALPIERAHLADMRNEMSFRDEFGEYGLLQQLSFTI